MTDAMRAPTSQSCVWKGERGEGAALPPTERLTDNRQREGEWPAAFQRNMSTGITLRPQGNAASNRLKIKPPPMTL